MTFAPAQKTIGKLRICAFLAGLTIVAFALRSYRMYPEFYSSDMVGAASFILDSVPDRSNLEMFFQREWGAVGNPLRTLLYHYSPLGAVLGLANVMLLSAFGVRINEYVWVLPMIVIGAMTPTATYVLVNKLVDRRSAVISALVIAVFPMHVIQSRWLGPAFALAFLTQVLALYALIHYLEYGKRGRALWLGASLAAAMYADFMWVGLLPVVLYAGYVYTLEAHGFRARVLATLIKLMRPDVLIIPLLGLLALATASIVFRHGPLLHLVSGSGHSSPGLYLDFFYVTLLNNSGYVMGAAISFFLFAGLVEIAKLSKTSLLVIWGLTYAAPFWFFKFGNSVIAYGNYGFQALAILSAVLVVRFLSKRGAWAFGAYAAITILLASSLYTTSSKTYGFPGAQLPGLSGFVGSYEEPKGMKAAGLWLRNNTQENSRIFAFDYGGTGMEPPNAFYYFNRTIIGKFDAPDFEYMYAFLRRFENEADFLVITFEDYQRIRSFVDSRFNIAAEVRNKGEKQLLIFSRERIAEVPHLELEEGNARFDEEFGDLAHLKSELKFYKSRPNPYAQYYWEGIFPFDNVAPGRT